MSKSKRKFKYDPNDGLMPEILKITATPTADLPTTSRRELNEAKKAEIEAWKNVEAQICSFCYTGGDILCCEGCPASFHLPCLPINEQDVPDGVWLCNRCTHLPPNLRILSTPSSSASSSVPNPSVRAEKERLRNEEAFKYHYAKEIEKLNGKPIGWPNNALLKALGRLNPVDFALPPSYMKERIPMPSDNIEKAREDIVGKQCCFCETTNPHSMMLKCDFCPLFWHLACVDPPLAVKPTWRLWMCPAHVEPIIDNTTGGRIMVQSKRKSLWDENITKRKLDKKALWKEFVAEAKNIRKIDIAKRFLKLDQRNGHLITPYSFESEASTSEIVESQTIPKKAVISQFLVFKTPAVSRKMARGRPKPAASQMKYKTLEQGYNFVFAQKPPKKETVGREEITDDEELNETDERRSIPMTEEEVLASIMGKNAELQKERASWCPDEASLQNMKELTAISDTIKAKNVLIADFTLEDEIINRTWHALNIFEDVRGGSIDSYRPNPKEKEVRGRRRLLADCDQQLVAHGYGNEQYRRRFSSLATEMFYARAPPPLPAHRFEISEPLRHVIMCSMRGSVDQGSVYRCYIPPKRLEFLVMIMYDYSFDSPQERDAFSVSSKTIWSKEPIDLLIERRAEIKVEEGEEEEEEEVKLVVFEEGKKSKSREGSEKPVKVKPQKVGRKSRIQVEIPIVIEEKKADDTKKEKDEESAEIAQKSEIAENPIHAENAILVQEKEVEKKVEEKAEKAENHVVEKEKPKAQEKCEKKAEKAENPLILAPSLQTKCSEASSTLSNFPSDFSSPTSFRVTRSMSPIDNETGVFKEEVKDEKLDEEMVEKLNINSIPLPPTSPDSEIKGVIKSVLENLIESVEKLRFSRENTVEAASSSSSSIPGTGLEKLAKELDATSNLEPTTLVLPPSEVVENEKKEKKVEEENLRSCEQPSTSQYAQNCTQQQTATDSKTTAVVKIQNPTAVTTTGSAFQLWLAEKNRKKELDLTSTSKSTPLFIKPSSVVAVVVPEVAENREYREKGLENEERKIESECSIEKTIDAVIRGSTRPEKRKGSIPTVDYIGRNMLLSKQTPSTSSSSFPYPSRPYETPQVHAAPLENGTLKRKLGAPPTPTKIDGIRLPQKMSEYEMFKNQKAAASIQDQVGGSVPYCLSTPSTSNNHHMKASPGNTWGSNGHKHRRPTKKEKERWRQRHPFLQDHDYAIWPKEDYEEVKDTADVEAAVRELLHSIKAGPSGQQQQQQNLGSSTAPDKTIPLRSVQPLRKRGRPPGSKNRQKDENDKELTTPDRTPTPPDAVKAAKTMTTMTSSAMVLETPLQSKENEQGTSSDGTKKNKQRKERSAGRIKVKSNSVDDLATPLQRKKRGRPKGSVNKRGSVDLKNGHLTDASSSISPPEKLTVENANPQASSSSESQTKPMSEEMRKKLRMEANNIKLKYTQKMIEKVGEMAKEDYFRSRDEALQTWSQEKWDQLRERCFEHRYNSTIPFEPRFFLSNVTVWGMLEVCQPISAKILPFAIQRGLTKMGTQTDCHVLVDRLSKNHCKAIQDYHCDIVFDNVSRRFFLSTLAHSIVLVNGVVVFRQKLTPHEEALRARFIEKKPPNSTKITCHCEQEISKLKQVQKLENGRIETGIVELRNNSTIRIGCVEFRLKFPEKWC